MSSTEAKKSILIETKLNSSNYNLWFFSIKIVLEDEDQHLEGAVIAEGDCPFVVKDTARAKRIIFLNCSPEVQATMTSCENAPDMWNYLYRQNSGRNLSRKNQGIKRLATFSFAKPTVQENMLELVNLITATAVAAGTETISIQELGIHMFLNALPSRFNSARALLEAREDVLTIEAVRKALISEEERITAREDHQHKFAGGVFKRCPHGRNSARCWTCDPGKHPSKATCKDCKTVGHFSKNSPKCALNAASTDGVAGLTKRSSSEDDSFADLSPQFGEYSAPTNDLRRKLLKSKAMMAADANIPQEPDVFVIDSGCTQSILMNKDSLTNFRSHYATFQSADYGQIICEGIGDFVVNQDLTITDCLFSKNISMNLISESQLCKQGFTTQTNQNSKVIKKNRQVILSTQEIHGLYIFRLKLQKVLALSHSRTQIFHRRMGHLNLKSLRLLSHLCDGMVLDRDPTELCPVCAQSKAHKRPYPNSSSLAKRIGELTHVDICHVGVEDLLGRCKMFLLIVDDSSRFMTIYSIQHKDDTEDLLKSYDKKLFIKTGRHLGMIRSDNGGEFINSNLEEYFHSNGTTQQTSTPYNPQQNGRAERPNRTVLEGISSMLLDAKLPWEYWALAAECFVYLKNRSPHAALYKSTPYQEWFSKIPDLTNIRVFGYPCYVYIPAEIRKKSGPGHKLLPKAMRMILVGYSDTKKAWKCYNPDIKQLVCSSNVEFDNESRPWDFGTKCHQEKPLLEFSLPLNHTYQPLLDQGEAQEIDPATNDPPPTSPIPETGEGDEVGEAPESPNIANAHENYDEDSESQLDQITDHGNADAPKYDIGHEHIVGDAKAQPNQSTIPDGSVELGTVFKTQTHGRWKYVDAESHPTKWDPSNLPEPGAKRIRKTYLPKNRVNFLAFLTTIRNETHEKLGSIISAGISDSPTFREAMASNDKEEWKKAIAKEYKSLFENGVFSSPCDLPIGFKPLDTKMVLKLKEPEGINIPRRHKARLCARGFKQEEGINYDFTFAPVAAYNSLRAFIAILASLDYEIHTVDVKTAFLHSFLKEEIYIDIPDGFPEAEMLRKQRKVLKLLKCLYGLKQSPKEWNQDLDHFISSLGFEACPSDQCIYVNQKQKQYLLVYVDDIIIGTKTMSEMEALKSTINQRFEISDKGEISIFLNMSFQRNRSKRVIYLSQPSKIKKLLSDSRLDASEQVIIRTPTKLPACSNTILTSNMCASSDEETRIMAKKPYKSFLGQILFIAITCRPDISTAVSLCGRFAQNPGVKHWMALLRIAAYLISTQSLALELGGFCRNVSLEAYSDANWGGDTDNRRSRSGHVLLLNGSPIVWVSKLQQSVALSSTESEYVALSLCCQDVAWTRNLLDQLGFKQHEPTNVFEDNASCIKIAESKRQMPGVKHVEIRYHFVRDMVQQGIVRLSPIGTTEMLADTLTKCLPVPVFVKHREALKIKDR